jgi:conjugal transfer pilus assembly protein TraF
MKVSATVVLLLTAAFCGSSLAEPSKTNENWLERKSEGFFWYNDPQETETSKEEPPAAPPPITAVTPPLESPPENPLAPLSTAWLKVNIPKYLEAAIDDPSPENVAAFLYLQKYAMDKSFEFMDGMQEVVLGNAALDESTRRPTATFGSRQLDDIATANTEGLVTRIGQTAGLFFFFDDSKASLAQANVVEMFEAQYPFSTVWISIGSPPTMPGKSVKLNNGHAEMMGVQQLPALVLMSADGTYDIISQSVVSLSDIKSRVLIGAKRLSVISDEEFNSTRPVANIKAPLASLDSIEPEATASGLPIKQSQLIQIFGGAQ